MAVQPAIDGDFATVLDGGEAITLKRRDRAETVAIAAARRSSSRTGEAEAAGGHVAQVDVVWLFAWGDAADPPRLGDAILDGADRCYTILSIEDLPLTGCVRCETRNLHFVYGLNDRVDVQRAVLEDVGGGPEVVGWSTVRAAVPARIQPEEVAVDNTSTPATSTAVYRILLGEQIDADADTRFVDPRGNVYQLLELTQGERIDVLPVARVVREV
jgi:hypothetical protein